MLGQGRHWYAHRANTKIRRLFGLDSPYRPLPNELLCPSAAERIPCRPGLFVEEQFSRVTGCGFNSTIEEEIKKLTETSFLERPPEIYDLGSTVVAGETLLTSHGSFYLGPRRPTKQDLKEIVDLGPDRVLINSEQGLRYFGHWLGDDTSAFELFHDHPGVLSLPTPEWKDRIFYQSVFQQEWNTVRSFHTSGLTLVRDLGFSLGKAERFRTLRKRLRTSVTALQETGLRIVYIRRGRTAERREIKNSEALEAALSAIGARIIEPETDTASFVAQLLDCDVVISVEGSQVVHAIYALREGGAALILQPPDRFYNPHHEWTRLLGMHYGTVIGETRAGGFHIYPEEVLAMLGRLVTRISNPQSKSDSVRCS